MPEPADVVETRTRKRESFNLRVVHQLTIIVEDTPNGFPRLAAFQSSEANFSLYRSFSYLHSRVLLDLQDEITSLEKELDDIDDDDETDDPDRLRSRELDVDKAVSEGNTRNRRVILREIRLKLLEYGMPSAHRLPRHYMLITPQMTSSSKPATSNPSKSPRIATTAASGATTTTPSRSWTMKWMQYAAKKTL